MGGINYSGKSFEELAQEEADSQSTASSPSVHDLLNDVKQKIEQIEKLLKTTNEA